MPCTAQFTPQIPWDCIREISTELKDGKLTTATAKKVVWSIGCLLEMSLPQPPIWKAEDEAVTLEEIGPQLMMLLDMAQEESENLKLISPTLVWQAIRLLKAILNYFAA